MKIGVLALQGAFLEHRAALDRLGVHSVEVRLPSQLEGIDGLILPGGESTTFAKLAVSFKLMEPLREMARSVPMFGTCAGLVFMAKDCGRDQPVLGVMDIVVERNAFGRQVDSFEADLEIKGIGEGPFHGVFIRAPVVRSVGPSVDVLAALEDGRIVAVRQGIMLASAFHPELTLDDRMHRLFLEIVRNR
ncbi:MAG: pyridoxal 5'-phosphate synthase glutaminase subunit PdxT [Thermodesulfobacteriota bacterium]